MTTQDASSPYESAIRPIHRYALVHSEDGRLTARAAIAGWRAMDEVLIEVLGQRVIHALFNRSVRRNRPEFAWLGEVEERTLESPGLVSLQQALTRQTRGVIAAAHASLLRDFRSDLAELIGESLCDALLQKAAERSASRELGSTGKASVLQLEAIRAQLGRLNECLALAAIRSADKADDAQRKLKELDLSSHRDPLTDTPNRALFADRLQSAIAMARRRRSRLALLFIDLDEFKSINDTYGHLVGDAVLKLVAQRLTTSVRDSDSVSRYGGDEFLVLLSEMSEVADAALIGREIIRTLAVPATIEGHALCVSASLGISLYPDHGDNVDALISFADADMYRTKRARLQRCPGT